MSRYNSKVLIHTGDIHTNLCTNVLRDKYVKLRKLQTIIFQCFRFEKYILFYLNTKILPGLGNLINSKGKLYRKNYTEIVLSR